MLPDYPFSLEVVGQLAGEEVYRKLTEDVQLIPTEKQQCSNKIKETINKPKVQPPNSAPLRCSKLA